MTARANIHIDKQELVGTRTVRIKFATDLLFAAGDVLELEISDAVGPYVISAVREMSEENWPNPEGDDKPRWYPESRDWKPSDDPEEGPEQLFKGGLYQS